MIREVHEMDRTYVLILEGRPVSEGEKRFNLLKAEQEDEEDPCGHCCSPDYTTETKTQQEAKNSPYIKQSGLATGYTIANGTVDLYQEIREIKETVRSCLFCGVITKERIRGQWIERLVGRQTFSNSTSTEIKFNLADTTSSSNYINVYKGQK